MITCYFGFPRKPSVVVLAMAGGPALLVVVEATDDLTPKAMLGMISPALPRTDCGTGLPRLLNIRSLCCLPSIYFFVYILSSKKAVLFVSLPILSNIDPLSSLPVSGKENSDLVSNVGFIGSLYTGLPNLKRLPSGDSAIESTTLIVRPDKASSLTRDCYMYSWQASMCLSL